MSISAKKKNIYTKLLESLVTVFYKNKWFQKRVAFQNFRKREAIQDFIIPLSFLTSPALPQKRQLNSYPSFEWRSPRVHRLPETVSLTRGIRLNSIFLGLLQREMPCGMDFFIIYSLCISTRCKPLLDTQKRLLNKRISN